MLVITFMAFLPRLVTCALQVLQTTTQAMHIADHAMVDLLPERFICELAGIHESK